MLFKVRIVVCFSILYLFALSGQARAQRRFEQAENGDSLADSDNEQLEESASQLGAEQDDSKAMEALNMQDQSARHEGSGPSYVSGTLITILFAVICLVEASAIIFLLFYIVRLRQQAARYRQVVIQIMKRMGKSVPADMQVDQFVENSLSMPQPARKIKKQKTPRNILPGPSNTGGMTSPSAATKQPKRSFKALKMPGHLDTTVQMAPWAKDDSSSGTSSMSDTTSFKTTGPPSSALTGNQAMNGLIAPVKSVLPGSHTGKQMPASVPTSQQEGTNLDGKTKVAYSLGAKSALSDGKLSSSTRRSASTTD